MDDTIWWFGFGCGVLATVLWQAVVLDDVILPRMKAILSVVLVWTAVILIAVIASGCAAYDVAKQRVGDRVEGMVAGYCDQPRSVRAVVRVETNAAVADRATIVIACKGEPGYDELRRLYVDPLSDSTIAVLIQQLLERGSLTLPDGTRLRVIADAPTGPPAE